LLGKVFLLPGGAIVATVPSALFARSDCIRFGAGWMFSFHPVLSSDFADTAAKLDYLVVNVTDFEV
jgi:hypothetical protein